MIVPKTTTIPKASGNPAKAAKAPMTGGPDRNPKYPSVVTVARPGPAPFSCTRPATPNRIGTRLAMPKPTVAKPISTAGQCRNQHSDPYAERH